MFANFATVLVNFYKNYIKYKTLESKKILSFFKKLKISLDYHLYFTLRLSFLSDVFRVGFLSFGY